MLGSTMDTCFRPGRHSVDNDSGMFLTGFTGIDLALCSHDCRQYWKSEHFSTTVLHFQHVQRSIFLRESICLSPRALTPVSARGLGGAGVAGSLDSQVTLRCR